MTDFKQHVAVVFDTCPVIQSVAYVSRVSSYDNVYCWAM